MVVALGCPSWRILLKKALLKGSVMKNYGIETRNCRPVVAKSECILLYGRNRNTMIIIAANFLREGYSGWRLSGFLMKRWWCLPLWQGKRHLIILPAFSWRSRKPVLRNWRHHLNVMYIKSVVLEKKIKGGDDVLPSWTFSLCYLPQLSVKAWNQK